MRKLRKDSAFSPASFMAPLRVKPTTCLKCLGKYIKTQGRDQEVCLICQRGKNDHKYTNVEKPTVYLFKKRIGGNREMDIYE